MSKQLEIDSYIHQDGKKLISIKKTRIWATKEKLIFNIAFGDYDFYYTLALCYWGNILTEYC